MIERRQAPRGRSYIGAVIVFNNRASSIDCLIRNVSNVGAKLAFTDTIAVPEAFDLVIGRQGQTRRSQLIWRHADEAGIAFVQPVEAPRLGFDHVGRLRQLEAENEMLKSKLAALAGLASVEGTAAASAASNHMTARP